MMSENLRRADTRVVVTQGLAEGTDFDFFAPCVDDKEFRSSPAFGKARNDIRLLYKAVRLVEGSLASAKRQTAPAPLSHHSAPLHRAGAPDPSHWCRSDPLGEASEAFLVDSDSPSSFGDGESESGSLASSASIGAADGEHAAGGVILPAASVRAVDAVPCSPAASSSAAAVVPAAPTVADLAPLRIPPHFYSMTSEDKARLGDALDAVTLTSGEDLPFGAEIARERYEHIREAWEQARRVGSLTVVPWMSWHVAGAAMQRLDARKASGRVHGHVAPEGAIQVPATAASAQTLSAVSMARIEQHFHQFMCDCSSERATMTATMNAIQARLEASRAQTLHAQELQDRTAARHGKFALAILQAACQGDWDSVQVLRGLFQKTCASEAYASERLVAALEFCAVKADASPESKLLVDRDLLWVMQLLGDTIRPEVKHHFRDVVCTST